MRIEDQHWEATEHGQVINRVSPSMIEIVAKIVRLDETIMTKRDKETLNAIAAAPDLIKACKAALETLEAEHGACTPESPDDTVTCMLRNALAKAKGGSTANESIVA